jgi:hypothetical protein
MGRGRRACVRAWGVRGGRADWLAWLVACSTCTLQSATQVGVLAEMHARFAQQVQCAPLPVFTAARFPHRPVRQPLPPTLSTLVPLFLPAASPCRP